MRRKVGTSRVANFRIPRIGKRERVVLRVSATKELPFSAGLSAKEEVGIQPEPTGGVRSGSLQVEHCCRRAQHADFKSSNPFQYQHGCQYPGMNG